MTRIKLSEPITFHKKEVTEITFRELRGRAIARCGMPLNMSLEDDGSGLQTANINAGVVAKLIVELGVTDDGDPVTSGMVDRLAARDFLACQEVILGFFGDAGPKRSSDGSTLPGPGNDQS